MEFIGIWDEMTSHFLYSIQVSQVNKADLAMTCKANSLRHGQCRIWGKCSKRLERTKEWFLVRLLPFQGDCCTSRIPKALPWADISLALQAAFYPTCNLRNLNKFFQFQLLINSFLLFGYGIWHPPNGNKVLYRILEQGWMFRFHWGGIWPEYHRNCFYDRKRFVCLPP